MSRGAGRAGILRLVGLECASLAARTSGLRGRGGEASGGAGDLRGVCVGVSLIVVLLLRLLSILTLSVPPGHLYLDSHSVHSDVVPSLYLPAGHGESTTPSVHL